MGTKESHIMNHTDQAPREGSPRDQRPRIRLTEKVKAAG
jgi:hypothetical protein